MSWLKVPCLGCLAFVLAATGDVRAREQVAATAGSSLLVSQFLSREEPQLEAYRARRVMRAENERFDARGELEVITELRPDGTFASRIVREEGSGYIRNKVLKKMLREEGELRRKGGDDRGGLTPANYVFAEASSEAPGERRILITPRRKDVLLVNGAMVLSPEGELLRVEGRLAKNPSFWTKRVHIVRRYARIAGVRVPIATESVADVRFAGRSRFEMIYVYDSINGQPVTHDPAPMRAAWRYETVERSDGVPEGLFDHATAP